MCCISSSQEIFLYQAKSVWTGMITLKVLMQDVECRKVWNFFLFNKKETSNGNMSFKMHLAGQVKEKKCFTIAKLVNITIIKPFNLKITKLHWNQPIYSESNQLSLKVSKLFWK
jgi:hypothetical protein